MVGLIQEILLKLIRTLGGQETLEAVLVEAGLPKDKSFRIDTAYSDEEWQRLLTATLKVLKITPEQAYVAYADAFYKESLERFPEFFKMSKNSYEFLCRQPIIHNSIAAGVQETAHRKDITDKFRVEKLKDKIITHYCSPNKLCGLYKELAKSYASHYKDSIRVTELDCMHKGADACEIHVEWESYANG